jgi:hypothetical protein
MNKRITMTLGNAQLITEILKNLYDIGYRHGLHRKSYRYTHQNVLCGLKELSRRLPQEDAIENAEEILKEVLDL